MRILELCLSPDLGGLELYAFHCAAELSNEHEVIGVIHPEGKLKQYFVEKALRWSALKPLFKPLPLFNARKLARIIDQNRIEVVHVHWGKDLPLAALAKRMSRTSPRLVATRHMTITRSKTDFYHNYIYKQIDLILTITRRMEADVKKFLSAPYRSKVVTHYHGVRAPQELISQQTRLQLREELGIPRGTFLAGIFGRIKQAKGQYLVIEAIKQLRATGKDICGLVVGHPMQQSYLDSLKRKIRNDGLEPHIRFKGFVDEPQRWMQVCDVVILASHGETFGLVLIEAMQAGVAVIGTNDGGVPEIIEDQVSGLLFQPGDSNGLASQLATLIENPQLRKNLAQAGNAKAQQQFDYEKHFKKLAQYLAGS